MDYSYIIAHQAEIFEARTLAEPPKPTKTRRGPCYHVDPDDVSELSEYLAPAKKKAQDVEMKSEKDPRKCFHKLVSYRSTTED